MALTQDPVDVMYIRAISMHPCIAGGIEYKNSVNQGFFISLPSENLKKGLARSSINLKRYDFYKSTAVVPKIINFYKVVALLLHSINAGLVILFKLTLFLSSLVK